ncbi:MAG: thiamine pyrophosphate-dependent dehydrogenase E1 component subunit alpha [Porticoccaceae bacterium]|jgi:pyruvate dehydrogenase E1 component alpha subunit|nr:thiamine pyrophosphate-dependent dehydrogenase E1 component subunit alpha [Porticoccaceae bacterium]MEA3301419.1 thiamine pyrophosphate-dependent dehydrogenase E1 component subunit alpha [Pseudomonadota bacterium]HLS98346.1 thiamine pyrophosphate-dependent dehydrogenase E1 component subunit alpha [Porticoccaceae bacterium]
MTSANPVQPDKTVLLDMYSKMSLIKHNDETARKLLMSGRLPMIYYSPRGQEVIPSAVSVNLRRDDYICTIYRGTHDMLAKGVPLDALWAELAGRATGTCKGKGGPMHITHPESGCMITTGIVGSSMPIANGLALASQIKGDGRVTVAYFGDAASNIGAFHEALNMASVWKLPVVFVCQNNRYGEHTKFEKATAVAKVSDRAASYSMPGIHVDGNDPLAMHAAAREAIERARAGEGPTLIEAVTFRFFGHVFGDADGYMDKDEKAAAMAADPVPRYRQWLMDQGHASEAELAAIDTGHESAIKAAVEKALAAPWPDPSELYKDVFTHELAPA